ncbi:hypothetical protein DFH06DRAFT_1143107 [Mycena polygramma]|nr:hypothetical protein DFH06DRAFT_1143107 [Mycena polygramma]
MADAAERRMIGAQVGLLERSFNPAVIDPFLQVNTRRIGGHRIRHIGTCDFRRRWYNIRMGPRRQRLQDEAVSSRRVECQDAIRTTFVFWGGLWSLIGGGVESDKGILG